MAIKAVIFDMDGVICHTMPYHAKAYQVFLSKRGIYPSTESFHNHMYGKNNSYILRHYLGRKVSGQEFLDMEEEKEGLFRKIYKDKVKPISGFLDFLTLLRSMKIKTGIATSAPHANMDMIVANLHLKDKMESFMASEDVVNHKPHPEIYLTSAKNLGVKPQECLVFEDSVSGIHSAKNAGMTVVGVLSSHGKADLPQCSSYIKDYSNIIIGDLLK